MKKSNKYLIFSFVILLVITFFVLKKEGGSYTTNEITEKFITFDSISIDKIEILKNNSIIALEKIAGEWKLTLPINYSADQETVLRLISDMKNGKFTSLISSKSEKQKLYEVDSSGIMVKTYQQGSKKDEFIVGKTGQDYQSTFIRKSGSNDVYSLNKSLSFAINRSINDWRNKNIFQVPLSTISEVKIEYGDTIIDLKKNQTGWSVDIDSANSNTIESFLSSISNISANDFIDTSFGLPEKPDAVINITSSNQDQIRFYRFKDNSNKYYVVNSRFQQVFVLESYSANNLLKKKKDFLNSK